jgi:serine/threonine-protein kinase
MELIDGHSLRALLPEINATHSQAIRIQGESAITRVLRLARQICLALETAHAAGIIHRDIKPENVLVTNNGTAKLMDLAGANNDSRVHRKLSRNLLWAPWLPAPNCCKAMPQSPKRPLRLWHFIYELLNKHQPFQAT